MSTEENDGIKHLGRLREEKRIASILTAEEQQKPALGILLNKETDGMAFNIKILRW